MTVARFDGVMAAMDETLRSGTGKTKQQLTGEISLTFNDLLLKAHIDPSVVRLMRNQDASADPGRTPFALWRNNPVDFVAYQSRQSLRAERQLKNSRCWASFVVTPSGETLLTDIYSVRYLGLGTNDLPAVHRTGTIDQAGEYILFDLTPLETFAGMRGRVVVEWGSGFLAWIQRADRQNKTIIEVRREYEEEQFPGFGEWVLNLSDVPKLPGTWVSVLKASRGIYLLSCPRTGEHYVGSATGQEGFLGRWLTYFADGHGGNIRLIDREPSNYRIAVLEVAGSEQSTIEVLAAEQRWMRKLQGALNSAKPTRPTAPT